MAQQTNSTPEHVTIFFSRAGLGIQGPSLRGEMWGILSGTSANNSFQSDTIARIVNQGLTSPGRATLKASPVPRSIGHWSEKKNQDKSRLAIPRNWGR